MDAEVDMTELFLCLFFLLLLLAELLVAMASRDFLGLAPP